MKLIVGLGNPGRRYAETRHNVGFEVVAELARRFGDGGPKLRFQGETVEARIDAERVVLLTPHTMMNRSGASVRPARDFYQLEPADVLVVCDDFQLPLARLRVRARGSSGGQKGLDDVIRCLGTEEVPRLRIGIGPVPGHWDVADFVLSKFRPDERDDIALALVRAADAAADWVRQGLDFCMNRYNASPI